MKDIQSVKVRCLLEHGFTIGQRDSRVNRAFLGKYMVLGPYEDHQLPTDDNHNGPYAVVGFNLNNLIVQAFNNFYHGEKCIYCDGKGKTFFMPTIDVECKYCDGTGIIK
jgi:hypothetical protein